MTVPAALNADLIFYIHTVPGPSPPPGPLADAGHYFVLEFQKPIEPPSNKFPGEKIPIR